MTVNERARHPDDALGLVAEEPGALDDLLDVLLLRARERFDRWIAREQDGRDHVDTLVGALRAQDRRDEQLKRRLEIELAVRVRVERREALVRDGGVSGRTSFRFRRTLRSLDGADLFLRLQPRTLTSRFLCCRDLRPPLREWLSGSLSVVGHDGTVGNANVASRDQKGMSSSGSDRCVARASPTRSRRAFANAMTSSAERAFKISWASSQPLRAMPTPIATLSSPFTECASGPISSVTPRSFARRHSRQSRSKRRGSALSSTATPVSAAFSITASMSTAYGSRASRSRPVG